MSAHKLTATYEKDTAKGKRRYRVEGEGIVGTLYINPDKANDADEVKLTVTVPES